MSRHFPLTIAALFAVSMGTPRWTTTLAVSARYCDNVFRLSPSDIDSFLHAAGSARFPYRSADDACLTCAWSTRWEFLPTAKLELRGRMHQFAMNGEKSYGFAALRVEKEVSWLGAVGVDVLWMPNYFIRHYRRLDQSGNGDYAECRFSEYLAIVELQRQLGTLRIAPGYGFEFDDYSARFAPYDSRIHRFGFEVVWQPVFDFRLGADYGFRSAAARGPVPDISYRQHELRASLSARPARLPRFQFRVAFAQKWRAYTTSNPPDVDPGHYGRNDRLGELDVDFRYRLGILTLVVGYQREWRLVDSPTSALVEDEKEYFSNAGFGGIELVLVSRGVRGGHAR